MTTDFPLRSLLRDGEVWLCWWLPGGTGRRAVRREELLRERRELVAGGATCWVEAW